MIGSDEKHLFFGFEVHAPWPPSFPKARFLDPEQHHLTVAFLGKTSYEKVQAFLPYMPKPPFAVGQVGIFDACLFLPPHHPRVVAYHMKSVGQTNSLTNYQLEIKTFLEGEGYELDRREFLPHVTLGRSPFIQHQWEKNFSPLPMYFASLHLYESLRNSYYKSLWSFFLKPPFLEIEHIADIAFHIFGENIHQIYLNAQIALCFECPALLVYLDPHGVKESLEDIIIHLNEMITQADQEIGTPFKAVSFHGDLKQNDNRLWEWEMIVDV